MQCWAFYHLRAHMVSSLLDGHLVLLLFLFLLVLVLTLLIIIIIVAIIWALSNKKILAYTLEASS